MTRTSALQAVLALEHEAVWLYPVIGAKHDRLAEGARASYDAHRSARDGLLARLDRLGVEPVGTALAYDITGLRTPTAARRSARRLEQRIAAGCLTLVGVTEGDERTFAVAGLRRAALAELAWGGKPTAFPGLP